MLSKEMWRNLSCGEMFPHDRYLHMSNEKCGANLLCEEISLHDRLCTDYVQFMP